MIAFQFLCLFTIFSSDHPHLRFNEYCESYPLRIFLMLRHSLNQKLKLSLIICFLLLHYWWF